MRDFLKSAVFEVFEKTLGEPVALDRYRIKKGYIAKVSFEGATEHEITGVFKRELLVEAARCLFFDESPDEDTLIDLSKELMNLFAGDSKTLASRMGEHFLISTPLYLGIGSVNKTKDGFGFCFRGKRFTIYVG